MAYRGTTGSYQQWADQVDDQSFTFESLLPYFQRSPKFTPPNYSKLPSGDSVSYEASAFSPTGGPLQVSYSNYRQPITPFIEGSMASLGVKSITGLNIGNLIGYSRFTATIDPADETRSSSETAFLRSAISNSSMQVYHNTVAKKILFDGSKKAIGVRLVQGDASYALSASKEVIIAAGVVCLEHFHFPGWSAYSRQFKSPQILMVSGVGPSRTLQRLGIPVVSDLAGVGQNLWVRHSASIYKLSLAINHYSGSPFFWGCPPRKRHYKPTTRQSCLPRKCDSRLPKQPDRPSDQYWR